MYLPNITDQFINPISWMTDDDIEELIRPTIDEINGILHADIAKTILYLKGTGLNEDNIGRAENDFAKALMIEPSMIEDSYVQGRLFRLIRNRIDQAKIGVLKVHGNYSIVCGDPFALCQHMFEMETTGLLKPYEIYNQYWLEADCGTLAMFRAPMTCLPNIRKVTVCSSDAARYWYRYMKTCTVFNAWDTAMIACNGLD